MFLIRKVKALAKAHTLKGVSKSTLLKLIAAIYTEKLKNIALNKNTLYTIAYDVLLQKYGLKSVTENKYCQV